MDADYVDIIRETGALLVGESDAKFNEEVFEHIDNAWEESEEQGCDAILGESLEVASKVKMEMLRKHGT